MKRLIIGSSLAIALVLATAGTAQAQEKGSAKGGGQQLMKPIKTVQDVEALEPGDMVAMSCPKCKTITVKYVEPTFKATEAKEKVKAQHTCPGCSTTIAVEGHGKAKKDVVSHVCQTCGSKDAFCCVLKKGSGLTKGMDKK
jgi:RNase P subunit RPR2